MYTFLSYLESVGKMVLPMSSGIRIQMMPIEMNNLETVPYFLRPAWTQTIARLFELSPIKRGIGYLTIDERFTKAGQTHRRPGLHVDGIGPWGDGGGSWGANGFLTVANYLGCEAYIQEFEGCPIGFDRTVDPEIEGSCEHFRKQCMDYMKIKLQPDEVYWMDSWCVHESVPLERDTYRTFVRLSMPSESSSYEGFAVNPTMVKPSKESLPLRQLSGRFAYTGAEF